MNNKSNTNRIYYIYTNICNIYIGPPCRAFTPMLADIYNKSKQNNDISSLFDIVFVSMDRDESQYKKYYNESHPWQAIPYNNEILRQSLAMKHHVSGIPAVVVLRTSDGSVIDANGRDTVMQFRDNVIQQWLKKA